MICQLYLEFEFLCKSCHCLNIYLDISLNRKQFCEEFAKMLSNTNNYVKSSNKKTTHKKIKAFII